MPRLKNLLLGNYRPSLQVVRSLARNGYPVIVGHSGANDSSDFVERSRFVREVWRHPDYEENPARFLRALAARLEEGDIGAIYPVSESALRFLIDHRQAIPEEVTLVAPPPGAVATCLDKVRMLQICEDAQVAQAPYAVVDNIASLHREATGEMFPCIVKPINSKQRLLGSKAVVCRDRSQLLAFFEEWPQNHEKLIIQRVVTGHRHNIYFCCRSGKLLAAVEVRIDRTDHQDGTGFAVEGVSLPLSPVLRRQCESLIAVLKYTGVGCAQFMVGENGSTSFLEINPRLGANFPIVEACGLPLSVLAVNLSRGQALPSLQRLADYRTGVKYVWSTGDLAGLKSAVVRRDVTAWQALVWLGKIAQGVCTAQVHVTWQWHDPLPTICNLLETFHLKWLARLRLADSISNFVRQARSRWLAMGRHSKRESMRRSAVAR